MSSRRGKDRQQYRHLKVASKWVAPMALLRSKKIPNSDSQIEGRGVTVLSFRGVIFCLVMAASREVSRSYLQSPCSLTRVSR